MRYNLFIKIYYKDIEMKEILKKSAAEQFEAIKNKEVKAVELLDATY